MNSMRSDFHIPSAPAASMNQFQNTKGQNPLRLPFATFRLILQLEKTNPARDPGSGSPFLRQKLLQRRRSRQDVFDIDPLRRVVAGVAGGAVAGFVLVADGGQEAIER